MRYFGVFAASAAIRAKVIRKPGESLGRGCAAAPRPSDAELNDEALRRALEDELALDRMALSPLRTPECIRRLDWAPLLQWVFRLGFLECPRAGGATSRRSSPAESWRAGSSRSTGSKPPGRPSPTPAPGRGRSASICIRVGTQYPV